MSRPAPSHLACALGLLVTAGLPLASAQRYDRQQQSDRQTRVPAPAYKFSGPYTHDNLTIYFIHGEDQIKNKKLLTLDEALAAKKVIVHETKNFEQLSIENVSDQDVFVQAGDIVKGGQQDRTLVVDMIVPAKSGKVPVASFCVEQGRWSKRDSEDEKKFGSSKDNLVGNQLKLATRLARNQGQVWRGVAYSQMELAKKLKAEVKDSKSETSYQLTLENKKLLGTIETYTRKLQGSLDKQKDVIGYAVAINGKVNNADVYANADLFRKLWPKLLKCSAIEAVVEKKEGKHKAVKESDVKLFLADPDRGKETEKAVTKQLMERLKETKDNVLIETLSSDKVILRRSYLKK